MKEVSIAILDDQGLVGVGMAHVLTHMFGYNVLFVAETGKELIQQLRKCKKKPDIVLLDIELNGISGIETAAIIHEKYKKIKNILFSSYCCSGYLQEALDAGVASYVNKSERPEELSKVIEDVLKYGVSYRGKFNPDLLQSKNDIEVFKEIKLTASEKVIMKLICEQHTDTEIADKMNMTPNTITTYKRELMKKVGGRKSTGLVVYAIKHKLYFT